MHYIENDGECLWIGHRKDFNEIPLIARQQCPQLC